MIRSSMGVLGVVALCAVLPAAARAQAADPDTTPPVVTIVTPADGATYVKGAPVTVSFGCTDDVALADCVGTVANGASLDTSAVGPGSITVTAHDVAGNVKTATSAYTVVAPDPPPPTLLLTLGQSTPFTPFVPGVAQDYSTTLAAHAVSSAADATLSVADPDTTAPGHLVNGGYVLAQALKATAASVSGTSAPLAAIGPAGSPTPLETWHAPADEDVTITFVQPVAVTDTLRAGGYAKTLTFTLSTTSP